MKRRLLVTVLVFVQFYLLASTPIDVTRLYNEANTAYEEGDMATAIYNLELASLLRPNDADITNNLDIAKTKVAVDIVEIDQFFLVKWIDGASSIVSPGIWKIVSICLLLLLGGFLYLKFVKGKTFSLSPNLLFGVLTVLLLLTIYLGSYRQNVLNDGPFAIVMSNSIEGLKEGPDDVSKFVKDISPGVKLEILDSSADWYKVSAMDKEQGWIKSEYIRRLRVDS